MRLLEREDALADLASALDEARAGRGSIAQVAGEAGIGKTALLRAFRAGLPGDVRVLAGGCDDLAIPRPLGPFLEMADAFPRLRGALEGDPVAAPQTLVAELRRERLTVCVVEDVHWADDATLDVLTAISRRVAGLPALVVISFRDDEVGAEHPLRRVLAAIPAGGARRVPLRRLSVEAVRVLAGAGVDVDTVHAVTGGNPFFVTEALAGGTAPTPTTVRDAVLARLGRVSRDGRAVAELVSVVPGQAELSLVAALVDPCAAALAACEAGGVLVVGDGAAGFRHEIARRAVEETLSGVRRVELHRAVLAVLEDAGASHARLVHHALATGDAGSIRVHGLAAGHEAVAAGSHREATELLAQVMERGDLTGDRVRADTLDVLSEEAYIAGDPDRAIDARERALVLRRALGEPLATGATLRWLSRLRWWARDRPGAEAAGEEAIRVLEELPPSRELAMALSNRAQLAMLAQRDEEAIPLAERAMSLADRVGDAAIRVHAQINWATSVVRLRLRSPSLANESTWQILAETVAAALDAGRDEDACRAMINGSWHLKDAGDYERARQMAARGLDFARAHEITHFEEYLSAILAQIDLATGAWDAARSAAETALPDHARHQTHTPIPALVVLGLIDARRGSPGASDLLDEAWRLARESGELHRIRPAACARAEVAWLAGNLEAVDAATRDSFAIALDFGHAWDLGELALWRHRAGVLDSIDDPLPAEFALEIDGDARAAAAAWQRIGDPYGQAVALIHAGDEVSLREAIVLLEGLGAEPVAALARDRLRRIGARRVPRGPRRTTRANPAGLTARQLEVLLLVAQGLTNAQIASRLVLSPRTVEHYVAAILVKLGAASRAEAVDAARARGVVFGAPQTGGAPAETTG